MTKKKQLLQGLLFLCLLFVSLPSFADISKDFAVPPLEGELLQKWMNLNYYETRSGGQYQSQIINPEYFLAANGQTSPKAEYEAFTSLLKEYVQTEQKAEVLCRYPARMTLLSEILSWFQAKQRPLCLDFVKQNKPDQVESISIIFASGYFGSPGSYFGHTLMKFNYGKEVLNQTALDSTLNYGAQITDSTGNPMYIVRGLSGGYTANYDKNNNFLNTHNYTNAQMRDVWEYELNLTPKERQFVVEHSWELMNAKFKYYFLSDNCANRIARLVELATGKDLTDNHGKWILPIQVVQSASETQATNDNLPLINKETRSPSLKTMFMDQYRQFSPDERKAFISFFDAEPDEQKDLVPTLDKDVLYLILGELDIKVAKLTVEPKNKAKMDELQSQRALILCELMKHTPHAFKERTGQLTKGITSPTQLKRPSVLQVGYTLRPEGDDALLLRYQAANNDLFTPTLIGQEASRFIMGAIEAEIDNDGVDLHKFTLLDIASLNTNPLPMRISQEHSWALKLEYGARNNLCDDCSTFAAEGKVGKAWRLTDDFMLYSLWGGRIDSQQTDYADFLSVVTENGFLFDVSSQAKLGFGINAEISPLQGNPSYLFNGTLALETSAQTGLRFSFENDGKSSALMTRFGLYFN